jgi:glycosyltransferase involved in cell wall biosynthesis
MSFKNDRLLSFVVPVKDEQDTLEALALQILEIVDDAIGGQNKVEIIFIDDGSQDRSWSTMKRLADEQPNRIFAIRLRRNFGKAAALEAGFRQAKGEIVFTVDADLQDDPNEIPKFLEALDGDLDLVSGWKIQRKDPISKKIPSILFNRVTAWLTGVRLHDFNCGFKAYRREVIDAIHIYGELHRYIPVMANDLGFRIGEIEVVHHPRRHGASKYGMERYIRGFVDLITVLATTRWLNKPGHLFGGIGVVLGLLGGSILFYLAILWILGLGPIGTRPLLHYGVLMSIFSVQMISLGIIAEFFIKTKGPRDVETLIAEKTDRNIHEGGKVPGNE